MGGAVGRSAAPFHKPGAQSGASLSPSDRRNAPIKRPCRPGATGSDPPPPRRPTAPLRRPLALRRPTNSVYEASESRPAELAFRRARATRPWPVKWPGLCRDRRPSAAALGHGGCRSRSLFVWRLVSQQMMTISLSSASLSSPVSFSSLHDLSLSDNRSSFLPEVRGHCSALVPRAGTYHLLGPIIMPLSIRTAAGEP